MRSADRVSRADRIRLELLGIGSGTGSQHCFAGLPGMQPSVTDFPDMTTERIAAAAGVVFDRGHRLLMIQRTNAPSAGMWSIPGGKCSPGEATDQTCVREIEEETGLSVRAVRLLGRVVRDGPGGVVFDIDDYLCELDSGTLKAGDDAAQARWVSRSELDGLPVVPGLVQALTEWDVLPV